MAEKLATDDVKVFIFPRKVCKQIVSGSPFVVKLETWLRLKKIKYEIVETTTFSKQTNTIPYIHLNGVEHSDANFIIPMLTERYGLDPTEGLTPEQQGAARAFHKMLDENTVWTYLYHRVVHNPDEFAKYFNPPFNWILNKIIRLRLQKVIKSRAEAQGIGRHTVGEMVVVGKEDIRALSQYLGDKQYLFGDNPTTCDCVAFGHLAQIAYVDYPYPHKAVFSECPNLKPYLDRLKTLCWPDWDDIVDMTTFD